MSTSRPGEIVMAAASIDVMANGEQVFYPRFGNAASEVGGTLYNCTRTAGDSDVLSADRVAVVYSLTVGPGTTGGAGTHVVLERHDGTPISIFKAAPNAAGQRYTFGPEGLRLPDFRVRMPVVGTGDPDLTFTLSYGID